jgi:DNA invertase Pin-like site-specific DNA recombinase
MTIIARYLPEGNAASIASGASSSMSSPPDEKLNLALKVLGPGDGLVVTRLDRLGRSLRDLANIAYEIENAGASLRVLDQSLDTATSAGKAFFGMLAVFALFETDVRRERQAEGIAKVMSNPQLRQSRYCGGTARIEPERVQMLKREGLGPAAIAASLGISRMSVYRVLKSSGIAK